MARDFRALDKGRTRTPPLGVQPSFRVFKCAARVTVDPATKRWDGCRETVRRIGVEGAEGLRLRRYRGFKRLQVCTASLVDCVDERRGRPFVASDGTAATSSSRRLCAKALLISQRLRSTCQRSEPTRVHQEALWVPTEHESRTRRALAGTTQRRRRRPGQLDCSQLTPAAQRSCCRIRRAQSWQ